MARVALCVLMLSAAAAPARAQSARPPAVSVGVALGEANPVSIELPLLAPVWSISVQFAPAKHLIVEAVASGWRHSSRLPIVLEYFPLRVTTHSVGVTALATARLGRWRVSSGAGAAIESFSLDVFDDAESLRTLSALGVMEADFAVTQRVFAFAVYRQSQPFTAALGVTSISGGVRLSIR